MGGRRRRFCDEGGDGGVEFGDGAGAEEGAKEGVAVLDGDLNPFMKEYLMRNDL